MDTDHQYMKHKTFIKMIFQILLIHIILKDGIFMFEHMNGIKIIQLFKAFFGNVYIRMKIMNQQDIMYSLLEIR